MFSSYYSLPTCFGSKVFNDRIDNKLAAAERENIKPNIKEILQMYDPTRFWKVRMHRLSQIQKGWKAIFWNKVIKARGTSLIPEVRLQPAMLKEWEVAEEEWKTMPTPKRILRFVSLRQYRLLRFQNDFPGEQNNHCSLIALPIELKIEIIFW